jgi:ribosomal protein L37AE/L43A
MEFICKCPFCQGAEVEPKGKLWHCNACGKDFEAAMVQQIDIGNKKNGSKPAPQKRG